MIKDASKQQKTPFLKNFFNLQTFFSTDIRSFYFTKKSLLKRHSRRERKRRREERKMPKIASIGLFYSLSVFLLIISLSLLLSLNSFLCILSHSLCRYFSNYKYLNLILSASQLLCLSQIHSPCVFLSPSLFLFLFLFLSDPLLRFFPHFDRNKSAAIILTQSLKLSAHGKNGATGFRVF